MMKRYVENEKQINLRSSSEKINELKNLAEKFSISKYDALKQFSIKCTVEQKNLIAGTFAEIKDRLRKMNENYNAEMTKTQAKLKRVPVYKFNEKKALKNDIEKLRKNIIINDTNLEMIDDVLKTQKIKYDYSIDLSHDEIYDICTKNMNVKFDNSLEKYLDDIINNRELIDESKMFDIVKKAQVNFFNRDENSINRIENDLKERYVQCINEIDSLSRSNAEITKSDNFVNDKNNDEIEIGIV